MFPFSPFPHTAHSQKSQSPRVHSTCCSYCWSSKQAFCCCCCCCCQLIGKERECMYVGAMPRLSCVINIKQTYTRSSTRAKRWKSVTYDVHSLQNTQQQTRILRKDKNGLPRFCASMYIANNMRLSLLFCFLLIVHARLPMSTTNQALRARTFLVRVSQSFTLFLSVCMCPTLFFFSLNFTPTLQNPYPFPSLQNSPLQSPIPKPHPLIQ